MHHYSKQKLKAQPHYVLPTSTDPLSLATELEILRCWACRPGTHAMHVQAFNLFIQVGHAPMPWPCAVLPGV